MTKSRIKRRSRARRWIECLFLLAGLVGVGLWVRSVASRAIFQDWENWVFDRELRGQSAGFPSYLAEKRDQFSDHVRAILGSSPKWTEAIPRPNARPTERSKPDAPRALPNNGLLGRLMIPRLHINAMIREGVGEATLLVALGHIPSTAFPGQNGNVGVAGHRDTLFRGLRAIHRDDLIRLETLTGDYLYQVEKTEIVSPQNVNVLNAGLYPELTLVTCFPFYYVGSAPDRFIVKARLVTANPQVPKLPDTQMDVAQPYTPRRLLDREPRHAVKRVDFEVVKNHSRQLAPGISIGLTETDVFNRRVDGWMWVMPDRRTIWLRGQSTREPITFYGREDGKKCELVISSVTRSSMRGYLLSP